MRAGLLLVVIAACYRPGSDAACSVSCADGACPAGEQCLADQFCHTPGQPALCAADAAVQADAAPDTGVIVTDGRFDALETRCPASFNAAGYLYLGMLQDWGAAEATCRSFRVPFSTMHTHLVVIQDVNDFDALRVMFPQADGDRPWVGLEEFSTPGAFRWVTNQPGLGQIPWDTASGQPDNPATQHCAKITNAGLDNDACGVAYAAICECDPYPASP